MRLTFRQGIARYQTDVYATPTFIRKSVPGGEFVDLIVSPDPTIIIFAHRNATYVVEESKTVTNAWGPFPVGGATKYLYWDINLLDASLTRGFTAHPPIVAGVAPPNPAPDQHWYDTTLHQMKVWNGSKWLDKLRVFAATYSSTAILSPMPLGTQAGETGSFEAGNLVLDEFDKPLRQSDGTFVTSVTNMTVINSASQPVKFEAEIFSGMADEYIPMFSFVQAQANRRIRLARSDDWKSRIIGLVTEDLHQSEVGNVTTDGLVRYEQWNWPNDKIGRPVFCGVTGEVTLEPPRVGVNQIAGYIYDKDSIFLNIQAVTILDDLSAVQIRVPETPLAPVADFFGSTTTGTVPLSVTFTSLSLHAPTELDWTIGDQTVSAASNEITHTFTEAGTYTVKLKAKNSFGQNEKTQTIKVNPKPQGATKTNLSIQLTGPLQVAQGQVFGVSVVVSNDGLKTATGITRVVTIDDMGSTPVTITNTPTGSSSKRVSKTTVVTLPAIASMVTGKNVSSSFTITAPNGTGTIKLRAVVGSPETDSTLSDNFAELSIKVK